MDAETRAEIEALRKASVRQLKERYRELFGGEGSPSYNRAHLWRRIAWRLQARREGSLTERAHRRAQELADEAELRLRAPRAFWQELDHARAAVANGERVPARDPRLPSPGSMLQRQYRDRCITAKVLADGFEYDGRKFGSLSAVAYAATGTRWNGFAFFGLNGGAHGG